MRREERRRQRLPPTTLALVAVTAVAGASVLVAALARLTTPNGHQLGLMVATAAACTLVLAMPITSVHRGELVHVHLDEAALIAGIMLLPVPQAIVAHAVGGAIGKWVLDRRIGRIEHRAAKRIHSLGVLLVDAAVVVGVVRAFADPASLALVLVGAGILASVVAGTIVSVTASSAGRQPPWPRLRESLLPHATGGLVAGALGASAGLVAHDDHRLALLLVPVLLMALLASRTAIKMSAARERLGQVLDATVDVLGAPDTAHAEARLASARELVLDPTRATSAYAVPREQLLAALGAAGAAALENFRMRDELASQARHDPLTGVGNRRQLDGYLAALTEARRPYAVVVADMDGLKPINDTLGHEAGDALLTAVAERLTSAVRSTDVVARIGGDEFVVLLDGADLRVARRLMSGVEDVVCAPVDLGGVSVVPSLSWGVAAYPSDGREANTVLGVADARMYEDKRTRTTATTVS
jgi:diguanylate cyclase (GGDEF)-like protein